MLKRVPNAYKLKHNHSSCSVMPKMSEYDTLNDGLIERLRLLTLKPNDNVDTIRSVAARLHSRAASQDKHLRDRTLERLWKKSCGTLTMLVGLLEVIRDPVTLCSLTGILHECVSPKAGKSSTPALSQLVSMNATQILLKLVVQMPFSQTSSDTLLQEVMWVLAQLAHKDSKFTTKVRVLGATKSFHIILRNYYNSPRLLYPILLVIKTLCRNGYIITLLVKDGFIPTMEKALISIGFSPNPKLKLALNVISHLSKNKLAAAHMMKSEIIKLMMRIFERWERYDGKMRLRICSYSLTTLSNICSTKVGRKTIRAADGLQLLHKFSTSCPTDRSYDKLLLRVCNVINMCLEKRSFPLGKMESPASFSLPLVRDSFLDLEEQVRGASSSRETSPATDDEDSGEEEIYDGSDPDKQDDKFFTNFPMQRDIDDLKGYSDHFREYHSTRFNLLPKSCIRSSSLSFSQLMRRGSEDSSISSLEESLQEPCGRSLLSEPPRMVEGPNRDAMFDKFCFERSLNSDQREEFGIAPSPQMAQDSPCLLNSVSSDESMVKGLSTLANIHNHSSVYHAYSTIASRVNSVLPFVKVAYPDMVGGDGAGKLEPLNIKDRKVCRHKLLTSVERGIHPEDIIQMVVFDLDQLASTPGPVPPDKPANLLYNTDERDLSQKQPDVNHLLFESRFESGNLRKVIQICPREYDLILMPDVNSAKHHQWFYFQVSNMEGKVPYVFNIINCEKQNSQFNYGMKPLLYSVRDAVLGRRGWVRTGTDICYFRNSYQNLSLKGRSYYTTTFTITFPHAQDVCYIAYHYPYTYTQLMTQIWKWSLVVNPKITYFRAESLCLSLNNNETPLLTISAPDSSDNPLKEKPIIFLTSRVHPGESNASWVMHGTLSYLLSDALSAANLRCKYVFKIVPMLNMEGVINGCHRCGLTDEDLNRRWIRPNQDLHPVIYNTKGLLEYCVRVLKKPPYVYCDYHGHSRRKNVFLYGCSNGDSWNELDRTMGDNPLDYLMLPNLMQHFSPAFDLQLCNFKVERGREATARVTVWRELGIKRSYTMETSYCGCDQGLYKGHHLDTLHLKEVGSNLCEALACLDTETCWRTQVLDTDKDICRFNYMQGKKEGSRLDSSESSDDSDSSDDQDDG